jgi:hypothetical protein
MFTLMYHRIKPTALPGLPRWLRLVFQWRRLRDTSERGEASTTAADKRPHRWDPWWIASPSSLQRCLPFVSLIFFPPITLPPFPARSRHQFLLPPSSSSSQHRCYISRLPLLRVDPLSSMTARLLFLAAVVFHGATMKSTIVETCSTLTLQARQPHCPPWGRPSRANRYVCGDMASHPPTRSTPPMGSPPTTPTRRLVWARSSSSRSPVRWNKWRCSSNLGCYRGMCRFLLIW